MDASPAVIVAILAGGQSRRMGRDKASLLIAGETLLVRIARVALAVVPGRPVLVVGRERPAEWPGHLPARFLADDVAGRGPLGGLVTALRATGDLPLLALACDMPLLSEAALRWLQATSASASDQDGLMGVQADGEPQPLFACYRPSCLPLAERRLAAGQLALRGLLAEGRFAKVPVPAELAACLGNVNTPVDLAALPWDTWKLP